MEHESIYIELDKEAVAHLHELMDTFGERRPDDMIATALGVMSALKDFVHDGVVTVVDPKSESDDPELREVEIVFEKARGTHPSRRAA